MVEKAKLFSVAVCGVGLGEQSDNRFCDLRDKEKGRSASKMPVLGAQCVRWAGKGTSWVLSQKNFRQKSQTRWGQKRGGAEGTSTVRLWTAQYESGKRKRVVGKIRGKGTRLSRKNDVRG